MEGVAQEETRRGEASDGVAILNLLTKHILADVGGRTTKPLRPGSSELQCLPSGDSARCLCWELGRWER